MKRVFVIILITLSTINIVAQKLKTDLLEMNLKDKVKSFTENTSRVENSRAGESYVEIQTNYVFNDAGNKIEFNSYINNELMEKTTYYYDIKGNKIKEKISGLTDIFNYDNKNNLIEWSRFRENSLDFKHIYTYNSNGNLIEDKSSDGFLTTYSYDKNGNKTENAYYIWGKALNYKKDLKHRITYKYDNNKNLIERNEYNPAESSFNQPARNIVQSYKYDNKGNLVEEIENGIKHFYKYDNYKNLIEETSNTSDDKTIYQYEYDKRMNWIKKIKLEGDRQTQVFERTYVYF